ncbi:MAG: hypothetical protein ACM31C_11465 [Acidobacteriota bacterium]
MVDAIVTACRQHCNAAADELAPFVEDTLYGSRNLIAALDQGLVTELEVANVLVARLETWLGHRGIAVLQPDWNALAASVRARIAQR